MLGFMTKYRTLETGEILSDPPRISATVWEGFREPVRKALQGSEVPLPEPGCGKLIPRKVDMSGAVLFDLELHAITVTTIQCGVAWTADGAESVAGEIIREDRDGLHALPYLVMRCDLIEMAVRDFNLVKQYVGHVAITILLEVRQRLKDAGARPPIATECLIEE